MRSDPFAGVDHASLERGVDVGGRDEDHRAARLRDHFAAEAGDAHLQTSEVPGRVDLPAEPSGHLRSNRRTRARY